MQQHRVLQRERRGPVLAGHRLGQVEVPPGGRDPAELEVDRAARGEDLDQPGGQAVPAGHPGGLVQQRLGPAVGQPGALGPGLRAQGHHVRLVVPRPAGRVGQRPGLTGVRPGVGDDAAVHGPGLLEQAVHRVRGHVLTVDTWLQDA